LEISQQEIENAVAAVPTGEKAIQLAKAMAEKKIPHGSKSVKVEVETTEGVQC
jgi:histidinol dehydrogenase